MLLHGYGGGPLEWHNVIPALESHHRLLIPNLTPLFSSVQPLTFSKQVEIVATLINQLNGAREKFVLVGSSYGGTLSWGLRAHFRSLVTGHILLNPMPLDPLPCLKSAQLRMLFGLNMVPGALPLFLKSRLGRDLLLELGQVFGFGHHGRTGLESLSERKLALITKAVQRFAWICHHEDWSYWTPQLKDHVIPLLLLTGAEDKLFHEKDFRSYQNIVPMSEHLAVAKGDHMMVKHATLGLADIMAKFIQSLEKDVHLNLSTIRHAI